MAYLYTNVTYCGLGQNPARVSHLRTGAGFRNHSQYLLNLKCQSIPLLSHSTPLFPILFPWYSHDFPMIFPWYSHDFPMIFPLLSHDIPMIFPWFSHDIPMFFPWFSHDFPMIFPCCFYDCLKTLGFSCPAPSPRLDGLDCGDVTCQ